MTLSWKVCLFGKFCLVDPSLQVIPLKSRRLENLLAVLTVEWPRGLSRSELSQILWPQSESKQGLRQSIYELRVAIGPQMIDATPDWCRLSEQFVFESDYHNQRLRASAIFMPEAEGEWFEWQRRDTACSESGQDAPLHSLYNSLTWIARYDAKGFFKLLETTPTMARGIEFAELKELVTVAQKNAPEARGWALYWRGVAEEDLTVCEGFLERAFAHAQQCQETGLASEVTLELGRVYARLGKMRHAYRTCQLSTDIAEHSGRALDRANNLRLRGTVNCYFNRYEEGIRDFEQCERHFEDTLGRTLGQMSHAYFLASAGRCDDALKLIDRVSLETHGMQHKRISAISSVVNAVAMFHSREGDWGASLMHSILERSWRSGFTQHGVCAAELLAQVYRRRGEAELSNQYLNYAAQGRAISKAAKTPLEFHRESLIECSA